MSGYAAPCCCTGRTCGGAYYHLFPACGSMNSSASCKRMLIQDATNNGLSKYDHIRQTAASGSLNSCFQLRCPEDPIPDCAGFGPDSVCHDGATTVVQAQFYTKASNNNCATCGEDELSYPNCDQKFSDCVGGYETDPDFKCLKIASSGFSYTNTSTEFPNAKLNISDVTIYPDTGVGGTSVDRTYVNQGILRLAAKIEYSVFQEASDCCDLEPTDPGYCGGFNQGCCHDLSCTGGVHWMILYVDVTSNPFTQKAYLGDANNALSRYRFPPDESNEEHSCGYGLNSSVVTQSRNLDLSDPDDCFPCSTFTWSGSMSTSLRLGYCIGSACGGTGAPWGSPCIDTSGSGFPFSLNFQVTTDAP